MSYPTVPPSPPVCKIAPSVTTGGKASLSCYDADGSPPPTYKWYKNDVPLPPEPRKISGFQNATYSLNTTTGSLVSYKFNFIFYCGTYWTLKLNPVYLTGVS